ncbi:NADH:ubiquinone reductase (Na(+)-transporting) subunit F [PVC group bacterium (ex Bugula neritina AB1)]|nr:NADH:ubiquinone reductase (Na(+)-transporting) subunit F [PVC group bacterium (ex Bugula neritina AB1)]
MLLFSLVSMGVFTGIILLLVTVLVFIEKKIVNSGECQVIVNADESSPLLISAGQTLLSALSAKKIFLPSACGGGGTCAMCKCRVVEGGGDVLPTETGHLSRGEQKDNVRLSCQVKVKSDMKIEIPNEIFNIKKYECTVSGNDNVATFIKELNLDLPEGEALNFEAGGYIQIDVPEYELSFKDFDVAEEYREDWDKFDLWSLRGKNDEPCFRAYSMANHPAEGNRVKLNVRIATPPPRTQGLLPGIASSYIFNLKPGDKVVVSGPYGDFFIKDTDKEMVYIGGGAGMAPMRSHLFHLFHTLKTGRKVSYWYGARSLREVFYQDEFQAIEEAFPNFSFHLALSDPLPEDNWTGFKGFIHQVVLDEYLNKHDEPEDIEYYLCGPPMMLSCVQDMLDSIGVGKENIAFDDFGG